MSEIYGFMDRAWRLGWEDRRLPARSWIRRALDRLGVPLDTPPPPGNLGSVASLLRMYQCGPDAREWHQAVEDLRVALRPGAMGVWAGPCPRANCDRTGTHRHIEDMQRLAERMSLV